MVERRNSKNKMPYIKPEDRKKWDKTIDEIVFAIHSIPVEKREGELNYFFTSILNGVYKHNPNYFGYNRAIGLLECIKQEFYRRAVAPYEDVKIKENGDVQ